jgi:eukaryotic-like serine/threonine-protein kinase
MIHEEPSVRLERALSGTYRLEREIGQGGMATVFLARDLKHERHVALKILRPELAAVIGAERFLNEIRVTANLQHPHILQLYDSGSVDGVLYYVMPYVEGESLRAKLAREKQLGVGEAIDIMRAVASALTYAHRQGIVHRDIKPENILLVDDQPVVADFGIALAVSAAGGSRLTETGLSLGTPHYMSPEQAMGDRSLDARSDVYSLGCVVFEMLVGEPPFTGPTAQAIIAKVITDRVPSVAAHRETVPAHVDAAVQRALAKIPADRFASPHDFAEALARPGMEFTAGRVRDSGALAPPRTRGLAAVARQPRVAWGVAGLMMVAVLAALLLRTPTPAPQHVTRFTLTLPQQYWLDGLGIQLSKDGQTIMLPVTDGREVELLIRRMNTSDPGPVIRTKRGGFPFLSPDGRRLIYPIDGRLRLQAVGGASSIDLAEGRWGGGDWRAGNDIVYTQTYLTGLWSVAEDGRNARQLSAPDTARRELGHWWPQVLPDGRGILFTAYSSPIERASIDVLLPSGERRTIVEGAVSGRYVRTGHLLFVRGRTLLAVPFDIKRMAVRGQPVPVLDDLAVDHTNGQGGYDISDNGTLIYVRDPDWYVGSHLVWVDRTGNITPVTDRVGQYSDPRLSPDGRRIAFSIREQERDIWLYDLNRSLLTRLTRHSTAAFLPVWTPDGRHLIYHTEAPQFDVHRRAADGSGRDEVLLTSPMDKLAFAVTPEGGELLFSESDPTADLWRVALDGSGTKTRLTDTPYEETMAALSPDGRWVAFCSDQSGRLEVYAMEYPSGERRVQLSHDGGCAPQWSRDGRELFYRDGQHLVSVRFSPATGEVATPVILFVDSFNASWASANYQIMPDGRFLMVRTPPDSLPRRVEVVVNWFEELRRIMAEGR